MIELYYPTGATPINAEEAHDLIHYVATQDQLNQLERDNIRNGMRWAEKSRRLKKNILSVDGIKLLHKRMFGDVWRWAGAFRTTDKNIGIPWFQIGEEVHKLCEDFTYQIAQGTKDWDRLVVSFHHRLVLIHPFPNGNGRHSRLCADLLLHFSNKKRLSWRSSSLLNDDEIRKDYILALKAADSGDIEPLILFATRHD